jgi:signal transduction histidine kinase
MTTLGFLAFRPGRVTAALYLAVGSVSAFAYQYALLDADPRIYVEATYLLNRLPLALVLVCMRGTSLLAGMLWSTCGFVLGLAGTIAADLLHGLPVQTGWGPTIALVVSLSLMGALEQIRHGQRQLVPDFSELEAETARIVGRRQLEERVTAFIHDTVLSDLATIAISGNILDQRARERFARDLALISAGRSELPGDIEPTVTSHTGLYTDILEVVSEFRMRGLTVELSGDGLIVVLLPEVAHQAIVWTLRACLENVSRHAGMDSVEVFIADEDDAVTVMVVDQGRGFDPDAVPADRLGIRSSITRRIESCGGSVRIWSSPGMGTSVVFSVPHRYQEGSIHA